MGFFRDLLYIKDILVVLLTPILLLPLLIVGDSPVATCGYAVVIMAVYWITEALPIAVTSLLPVFLFPILGLMTVKETSMQYINDTNMLFVGGLIVAATIEHWNIHRRIALRILMLVGSEPRWIMLGLMGPTWFLSMWISNTATTAMMVPIANAILLQLKDTQDHFKKETGHTNEGLNLEMEDITIEVKHGKPEQQQAQNGDNKKEAVDKAPAKIDLENIPDSVMNEDDDPAFKRMCKCLTLSIAYAANTGGIGSLTGTGPNLVLVGQLDIVYESYGIRSPITFANWMGFGVPTSLCMVIITWIWLQIYFLRCGTKWLISDFMAGVVCLIIGKSWGCCSRKNPERDTRVREVIQEQYNSMGPISFGQAAVIGHFVLLAVLWITRDLGGEFGWGHIFPDKYIKDAVPAVFIACLLFVFPSELPRVFCARSADRPRQLKPIMNWSACVAKVPWGVMFLLGGGFAMAHASQQSGLSAWVGEKLTVLDYLEPWVLNLVLCYIVAAMTEVTSNTATCTLMMPILANLAIHLKQNPLYLMFPTAIATSFAFMLPVATPPNAVVFSYGYLRVLDMAKAGLLMNLLCVLFLIGSTETIGNAIFDFHTVPSAILDVYQNGSAS